MGGAGDEIVAWRHRLLRDATDHVGELPLDPLAANRHEADHHHNAYILRIGNALLSGDSLTHRQRSHVAHACGYLSGAHKSLIWKQPDMNKVRDMCRKHRDRLSRRPYIPFFNTLKNMLGASDARRERALDLATNELINRLMIEIYYEAQHGEAGRPRLESVTESLAAASPLCSPRVNPSPGTPPGVFGEEKTMQEWVDATATKRTVAIGTDAVARVLRGHVTPTVSIGVTKPTTIMADHAHLCATKTIRLATSVPVALDGLRALADTVFSLPETVHVPGVVGDVVLAATYLLAVIARSPALQRGSPATRSSVTRCMTNISSTMPQWFTEATRLADVPGPPGMLVTSVKDPCDVAASMLAPFVKNRAELSAMFECVVGDLRRSVSQHSERAGRRSVGGVKRG